MISQKIYVVLTISLYKPSDAVCTIVLNISLYKEIGNIIRRKKTKQFLNYKIFHSTQGTQQILLLMQRLYIKHFLKW